MNKLIEKELNKLKIAKLSAYDELKHSFFIPKHTESDLKENHCYIIKLEDCLLEDSTLADNWNKGTKPPTKYLQVEISKIMANMVRVNAIDYNYETKSSTNKVWNGWLIKDNLEIIDEI